MRALAIICLLVLAGCQYDPFTSVYTTSQPKAEDLTGVYRPDGRTKKFIAEKGHYAATDPVIILAPDGTLTIKNIPDWWLTEFGKPQGGFDSGQGSWNVLKHQDWWVVGAVFHSTEHFTSRQYRTGIATELFLIGEKPPYKIHQGIGDPDDGYGMNFERVSDKAP